MTADPRLMTLESDRLRVALLPNHGAKIVSIVDRATHREWMAGPGERRYANYALTTPYEQSDRSGWDECFPSIGPGYHPAEPWDEIELADHGELWQRAWRATRSDHTIRTEIPGGRFPYVFFRDLHVDGDSLQATYRVDNHGDASFPCLWAMHPLFAAGRETHLVVPEGAHFRAEACFGGDVPEGPLTIAQVEAALDDGRVRACKLFCDDPPGGRAALYDVDADAWLGLEFELEDVPFLGVWINRGGWPPAEPLHHVALEATTGASDDLAEALRRGGGRTIPAHSSIVWTIGIRVGVGRAGADAFVAP